MLEGRSRRKYTGLKQNIFEKYFTLNKFYVEKNKEEEGKMRKRMGKIRKRILMLDSTML